MRSFWSYELQWSWKEYIEIAVDLIFDSVAHMSHDLSWYEVWVEGGGGWVCAYMFNEFLQLQLSKNWSKFDFSLAGFKETWGRRALKL